jgi:hypothetical protein
LEACCGRLAGTNYTPDMEILANKVEAFEASVTPEDK